MNKSDVFEWLNIRIALQAIAAPIFPMKSPSAAALAVSSPSLLFPWRSLSAQFEAARGPARVVRRFLDGPRARFRDDPHLGGEFKFPRPLRDPRAGFGFELL